MTFATSMFSFCASSVANWSSRLRARPSRTRSSAGRSSRRGRSRASGGCRRRASRRSRRSPRSGRRPCSAERTFAASTPVAEAMSSTTVSSNAPRSKRRLPLRRGPCRGPSGPCRARPAPWPGPRRAPSPAPRRSRRAGHRACRDRRPAVGEHRVERLGDVGGGLAEGGGERGGDLGPALRRGLLVADGLERVLERGRAHAELLGEVGEPGAPRPAAERAVGGAASWRRCWSPPRRRCRPCSRTPSSTRRARRRRRSACRARRRPTTGPPRRREGLRASSSSSSWLSRMAAQAENPLRLGA